MSRAVRAAAAVLLAALGGKGVAAPGQSAAGELDRRVQIGEPVEDVELPTLDGGRAHLLARGAAASVFVFFRPEQERSADALREMASCEREFERRPVHWVGVVSDAWPAEQVRALVKETGIRMSVLVDTGDALYGKLGIRIHPVVGIVDRAGKLAEFEPFRQINYCERIRVRIRWLLGEATEADVAKVDAPESSPVASSGEQVAKRHLAFARRLHELKQHDAALAEVQKAMALAPSAAAWSLRGQILAAQGKCPDALRAFDEALKLEPASAVAIEGRKGCGK